MAPGYRALTTAAAVSAGLALAKFALGLASGSLVVLASAADSFADALMSTVNRWGYGRARVPADEGHPYGHGKLEGAMAVGQGMLLCGIVVSLAATSVAALMAPRAIPTVDLAVGTLLASAAVSLSLAVVLGRAARRERSVVLEADRAHYTVDLLTAAGAVGGLLLAGATGWAWLDPALCLLLALIMAREAWRVLRRGAAEILDEALPDEELVRVRAVLDRYRERVVAIHGLRSRRSGPLRFVEVHVVVPSERPFGEVHDLVEDIGRSVREELPGTRVLVHPDAQGRSDSVDEHLDGSEAGLPAQPSPAPRGEGPQPGAAP